MTTSDRYRCGLTTDVKIMIVLAIVALLAIFSLSTMAVDGSSECKLKYEFNTDEDQIYLVGYEGAEPKGTLVVPDEYTLEGKTLPVTEVGPSAFIGCKDLLSVKLGANVGFIDSKAFMNCVNLRTVIGLEDVEIFMSYSFMNTGLNGSIDFKGTTVIESYAFADTDIVSVSFPDDCYINSSAFTRNHSLTKAILPKEMDGVPVSMFAFCENLCDVTLPESLYVIGNCAFKNTAVTKMDLPQTVVMIGSEAFAFCHELTEINLPDYIEEIGECAFMGCCNLEGTLYLPIALEDVLEIGYGAFAGTAFDSIVVPASLSGDYFVEDDLVLYENNEMDGVALIYVSTKMKTDDFAINPDTEFIADLAMMDCKGITGQFVIGDGLELGDNPFAGSGIKDVVSENEMYCVEDGMLFQKTGQDKMKLVSLLADKMELVIKDFNVGGFALCHCDRLSKVRVENGVYALTDSFTGADSITMISFADGVRPKDLDGFSDWGFKDKNGTPMDLSELPGKTFCGKNCRMTLFVPLGDNSTPAIELLAVGLSIAAIAVAGICMQFVKKP